MEWEVKDRRFFYQELLPGCHFFFSSAWLSFRLLVIRIHFLICFLLNQNNPVVTRNKKLVYGIA